jgi:adenosine deaminase
VLPLIDLHRHLEGAIRASTVVEIATRDGHALAGLDRPRDHLVATTELNGLLEYLGKVDIAVGVLRSLDDWNRAGREVVEDAFNDGLDYVEFRFAPWIVHQDTGLAPEAVIDAIADGVRSGSQATGLPVGLIGIVLRDLGPAAADTQIDTFLARRDVFCGVDLAGNEAGFAAELFAAPFSRVRDAGMHVTAHAGEAAGPESVRVAVELLGAERIGHGVRAVEDPQLLEFLARRGTTLDVALTSNTQTGAAPSYREHQIHRLLAAGVAVTLNTDDPRVSNVTLSQEHQIARTLVGLTEDQLATVARQSVAAAFTKVTL